MVDFDADPVARFLTTLSQFGLENTNARRFYSKYPGRVTDNNDPSKEGRVKVLVDITGQDQPLTLWAVPSSPYAGNDHGVFFPPDNGDMVWVWFDHGDPTQPNYSGGWWCNPSRLIDAGARPDTSHVPKEFKGDGPPKVRGIKTAKGVFLFSDDPNNPGIEISTITPTGVGTEAIKNHSFRLSDAAGQEFISLITKLGNTLSMDEQQLLIVLSTPDGPRLVLDKLGLSAFLETNLGSIVIDDATQSIEMTSNLKISQNTVGFEGVYEKFEIMGKLASVISAVAGVTITASAGAAVLSGLTVALASTTAAAGILLGVGAVLRLVTELLIGIFNANVAIHNSHTHPLTSVGTGNIGVPVASVGVTGPPVATMAVADIDSVTTNTTRAS